MICSSVHTGIMGIEFSQNKEEGFDVFWQLSEDEAKYGKIETITSYLDEEQALSETEQQYEDFLRMKSYETDKYWDYWDYFKGLLSRFKPIRAKSLIEKKTITKEEVPKETIKKEEKVGTPHKSRLFKKISKIKKPEPKLEPQPVQTKRKTKKKAQKSASSNANNKRIIQGMVDSEQFKFFTKPGRCRNGEINFTNVFPSEIRSKPAKYRCCITYPKEFSDLTIKIKPFLKIKHSDGGVSEIQNEDVLRQYVSVKEVNPRRVAQKFPNSKVCKFLVGFLKSHSTLRDAGSEQLKLCFKDKNTGVLLHETNFFSTFSRKTDAEKQFWNENSNGFTETLESTIGKKRKRRTTNCSRKRQKREEEYEQNYDSDDSYTD